MTSSDLDRLYGIIGSFTPLAEDCGRLCGAACCGEDNGETLNGVDLLPVEVERLSGVDWADIERDPVSGRPMLMCKGACDRDFRPWLCRIFPLCPSGLGTKVRMDSRARGVCPLTRYGLKSLDTDFKRSVLHSCAFLSEFDDGKEFLEMWETLESEFRSPLW